MMRFRLPAVVLAAAAGALVASSVSVAGSTSPQVVDDSNMSPQSATVGGASPLATTTTVQHWYGQTLDPHNGVTYGYNMVGADPSTNGSATVPVDIIPLNINISGTTFYGDSKVAPVLSSPLFQSESYTSTSAATAADGTMGPGGKLSAGNKD